MATYFYLCSYPLANGSVVNPGNWGRIISSYSPPNFGNPWILVRELLAESIRVARYPSKPSRMKSIFLCEDLAGAEKFKVDGSRPMDMIFEVELVDPFLTIPPLLDRFRPQARRVTVAL